MDAESGQAKRRRMAGVAARMLGSPPVARIARSALRRRLPVLAYHDVTDAGAFAAHLDVIQEHFKPVTGAEVALAVRTARRLPRGAIWLTFDDAHPGVVTNALPLLAERVVPATLFVCPGVVDTDQPYWWQVMDQALAAGIPIRLEGRSWTDGTITTRLKRVPDKVRRAAVARTTDVLVQTGRSPRVTQTTSDALREWVQAGLDVGNHTWDHPCLDMCDAEQQRRQILEADEWLRVAFGTPIHLFAYPNGNTAPVSRRVLAEHGYAVAALFDHRLSRARGPEISRLRVDASAPVHRLTAIASGAHPAAFAVANRVRGSVRSAGARR